MSLFLDHPDPRPSVLYLPELSPPSALFSLTHSTLQLLCPCSKETDPLAILEFLHRVVDVFEDFLGSPLLPTTIEAKFDVVAQLLGEMCDGGIISSTEANTLRENVEVSTALGKLFTQIGLSGYIPSGTVCAPKVDGQTGHHQLLVHRITWQPNSTQAQI